MRQIQITYFKPLKLHEIWSIRIRIEMAIDSKLRSCDLVKLRVSDSHILKRAMVMQQKTRTALTHWIEQTNLSGSDYLFKGQTNSKGDISTRQYARIVKSWIAEIGLNPLDYGTHSLRRTKATLIGIDQDSTQ